MTFLKKVFFLFALFSMHQLAQSEELSHEVLVSVAPHKYFVEKIAKDFVKVRLMVPAGASAHTYEPTFKQMLESAKADVWFYVGEGFESKVKNALQSHHPSMKFVDMRQNVNLILFDNFHKRCCHHHHDNYDLHYWLSPREAKTQAETIAKALIEIYPDNKDNFSLNLEKFKQELTSLDEKIKSILSVPHNTTILVSHPAYAYFCRDYGFRQLSIEVEGKDPTPNELTNILKNAKLSDIKTVFVQIQYSNKGANLIARQIGAQVVTLNPYDENYESSMLEITASFSKQPVSCSK